LSNFNKYVVIPLEICDLKKDFLNKKTLEVDIKNCVIKLPSYIKNANISNIIQEYGGISLYDYKKKNKELLIEDIVPYYYQLLKSVKFLNDNGIVHRDIKDNNMIIDTHLKLLRLIDFGFGMFTDEMNNIDNMNNILIGTRETYEVGYQVWSPELYIFSNFYMGKDLLKISNNVFMKYYNLYKKMYIPKEDKLLFKNKLEKELIEINKKVGKINNSSNSDLILFWKNSANNKLDIFSLGMFLINEIKSLKNNNIKFINDLKKLIYDRMLIMDSNNRININECITLFVKICKKHNILVNFQ